MWQATLELFWPTSDCSLQILDERRTARSLVGRLPQFQTTIADFRRCDNRSALVDLEKADGSGGSSRCNTIPISLTRSLQIQGMSAAGGRGSLGSVATQRPAGRNDQARRGDDATDQLEFRDQNPNAVEAGIHPQLAAREAIVYPSSDQLQSNNALAKSGAHEIIPMQSALMLFIWSKNRIIPVRLTDFSITGEAFDPSLNPIRAKVSLGCGCLSVNDVGNRW